MIVSRLRTSRLYVPARRVVVRRLRGSATVRRVAEVVGQRVAAPGPVAVSLPAGSAFPPGHGQNMPVVVLVATGLDGDQVRAVAEHVQRVQVLHAAFRAVFVLDRPSFRALRPLGYAGEVLLDAEAWGRLGHSEPWSDYLARNVRRIVTTYGATRVVPLHAQDVTGLSPATTAALISAG